jgi:putative PIN family toxin of toxin-antitoxin system
MIREILEVLQRPEITRKFRTVADFDLGRVLDLLAQAEVLETTELSAVSRDPKDDKILATAAAGSADYIVSEDRDLLDLVEYAGVRIVDTASFLGILLNDGET